MRKFQKFKHICVNFLKLQTCRTETTIFLSTLRSLWSIQNAEKKNLIIIFYIALHNALHLILQNYVWVMRLLMIVTMCVTVSQSVMWSLVKDRKRMPAFQFMNAVITFNSCRHSLTELH